MRSGRYPAPVEIQEQVPSEADTQQTSGQVVKDEQLEVEQTQRNNSDE